MTRKQLSKLLIRSRFIVLITVSFSTAVVADRNVLSSRDVADDQTRTVSDSAIEGTVVAADSGQATSAVIVTLRSTVGSVSRTAVTDDNGQFRFGSLPAGQYLLSASKPGFLDSMFGEGQPGSGTPGTPIQLVASQLVRNVVLAIARAGAIEGIVRRENGEAAPKTQVRVLRREWRNGERVLQAIGPGATADDRGAFRIAGLAPGMYAFFATPPDDRAEALGAELKAKLAAQGRVATFNNATADDIKAVMKDAGISLTDFPAPASGYAPVYYPGTTFVGDAGLVALGVSQQLGGIDISLRRVGVGTIAGLLAGAPARTLASAQLYLISGDVGLPPLKTTHTASDGSFIFEVVPPGNYTIQARASMLDATSPRAERLWATAQVTVSERSTTEGVLSLRRGVVASGTLRWEGGPPSTAEQSHVSVSLVPLVSGLRDVPLRVDVDASGRFAIVGVVPGKYSFSVTGLPNAYTLRSAVFGDQDAADGPLDIPDYDVESRAVIITSQLTQITGAVSDSNGKPTPEFSVIVFPSSERAWVTQSRRIRAIRTTADGQFSVRVQPGRYYVVAVGRVDPGQLYDPEFLRHLVPRSAPVAIESGETKVQNIRVQ